MGPTAATEAPSGVTATRPFNNEFIDDRPITSIKRASMRTGIIAAILAVLLQSTSAFAQATSANDPTMGFDRLFGLGGQTCKQYDDTGRLYLYTEGLPSSSVVSWLQRSDNGTKPNIPMPQELADALPRIPGCMPGKHHAASASG
jgi:hypothetical protein